MSYLRSDLHTRVDAIQEALAAAPTPDDREQLKQQIAALFRDAETASIEARALKDSVTALIDRWKQLDRAAAPVAAAPSARIDHLGASTFIEKGWSKLSLDDAAGAELAFCRALELAPGGNEAETLLGWAQMLQQRSDEALATLQRVLARDPAYPLALTTMGALLLKEGRYGEAIEQLSRVIRLDLDRKATLYAHLYLGMVYREREMYDDAETFFRKALELGPNLLQGWYELGRAHWFAARFDDAIMAWRAGAEASRFSPWGKRCTEMLGHVAQGGVPPRFD